VYKANYGSNIRRKGNPDTYKNRYEAREALGRRPLRPPHSPPLPLLIFARNVDTTRLRTFEINNTFIIRDVHSVCKYVIILFGLESGRIATGSQTDV
jgi:hypothetical protein